MNFILTVVVSETSGINKKFKNKKVKMLVF